MPFIGWIAPFIPFSGDAPAFARGDVDCSSLLRPRGADAELRGDLAALHEELQGLRQMQTETQERLDFAERIIRRLRDARPELPRS
jgi:hypothetical protein